MDIRYFVVFIMAACCLMWLFVTGAAVVADVAICVTGAAVMADGTTCYWRSCYG